ncbi:PIN domain-containing protein [Sphingomonas sp. BIUV-7]|uniref:PIN domain-containing protein n=1 Tax=Sphingomonas natans TaxID=3063330 RepID=A0ABT8Y700_9SPHN|nr:PIN domain-containing protein [Sphingomonas sp. BIUV-7]MDO6414093.1 PIN domain-containing protein [Sphingomonas sp. BIUV-7]
MAYDAITIDTNIAIRGDLDLEAGLLGQLSQFKDGQIDLVLSEIVVREMHKHLVLQVKKTRDQLLSVTAKVDEVRLLTGQAAADFRNAAAELDQPITVAGRRLRAFLEATGAGNIPVSLAPMDAVVKAYFGSTPPFETAGAKKSEFPDAIALVSIEAWAKDHGKKVLAVSQDGGWQAFADKSEWIDVEADLAKALEILQEHTDAAGHSMAALLAAVESGEIPALAARIEAGIERAVGDWQFQAEGDGVFSLEVDSVELVYQSYEFEKLGDHFDITIVRLGSDSVAARIGVSITATAMADFSLYAWDSVDKEHMGMGSQSAERDVTFDGAILLNLAGSISGAQDDLEVDEVELVDGVRSVDFGEIHWDRDDEDYEAWLAENPGEEGPAEAADEPGDHPF